MVVNIHYALYFLRCVFFNIQMYEYFCLSWFLHVPKVQANANKNTKCLFCTPELFYLSSSNDSSYCGVRLAGQHGGDTQNKVIIIHEVLLCMLLHVLLQCYNFYIHEYSNHTRYFNLLIASHSLALQCMRLLMKNDKLHPQRNSWSHRRRGGKSLKYKCTAYFWTSRGEERHVWFVLCCFSRCAEVHLQCGSEDEDSSQYWHGEKGPEENPVHHLRHKLPVLDDLDEAERQGETEAEKQALSENNKKLWQKQCDFLLAGHVLVKNIQESQPLVWSAPSWCACLCSGLNWWLSPACPARPGSRPPSQPQSLYAGGRVGLEPPSSPPPCGPSAPGCASPYLGNGIWGRKGKK